MKPEKVTAYAPGSVGNIGPGLDILGLALAGAGDRVTLEWKREEGITIAASGHPSLPDNPAHHTAAIAAAAVLRRGKIKYGARLFMAKGLPLSGGQGGSAASAVAGAVAANALFGCELDATTLLACTLEAEETISGRHADNLAPSLLGGMILIRSLEPIDLVRIPVPPRLRIILVHPEQHLLTRTARTVLPDSIPRDLAMYQAAQVASMIAGACQGNLDLLGRAIDDRIAEPVRESLLPGFSQAKLAALEAGALGASISGAGPTSFAITDDEETGKMILQAMVRAYASAGLSASGRVTAIDLEGARIIP